MKTVKKDTKAKGGNFINEVNELAEMYFESGLMVDLFDKFPEIQFIDRTCNVNCNSMPFMEDGFGYGQNVFYSATAQEDSQHMLKII